MPKPATRIALVDDDISVRTALGRLLSANDFDIETFASAREFLNSLKGEVPECLVVDLQMPDLTGLDLQRHLRRAGFTIPTVVITAHDEAGIRERCQSAGAAQFLLKPLNSSTLIGAIKSAIGAPNE